MSTDVLERPEARNKPVYEFGVRDLVYQQELPNVPGKSVTTVLVNYAPGGKSVSHHNAGSVMAYVLTGQIRSENSATGPAKGLIPASSMPATGPPVSRIATASTSNVGLGSESVPPMSRASKAQRPGVKAFATGLHDSFQAFGKDPSAASALARSSQAA